MDGLNKTENNKLTSAPRFIIFYHFSSFLFIVTLGFYSNFKDTEVHFYTVKEGEQMSSFASVVMHKWS